MHLQTFLAATGLLNGVTSFGLGLFVLCKNPAKSVNRTYFLFNLSITLWSAAYIFWPLSHTKEAALFWFQLLHYGAAFIPATYYHFVLALTNKAAEGRRSLRLGYLLAVFFALLIPSKFFIRDMVPKFALEFWAVPGVFYHPFLVYFFSFVIMTLRLLWKEMAVSSGAEGSRYRHVLIATLMGYAGGSTNFPLWYDVPIYPVGNILVTLYVAIIAYAIVRYRLLDINLAITRTAVFVVVYTAVLGLPLWAALTWQPQLEAGLGHRWWVWVLLVYAALATAAHYVNLYFQGRAEERLLAEQRRYQGILRQAAQGMTRIKQLDRLLRLIVHLLTGKVRTRHSAVYLWDEQARRFMAKASRQWAVKDPPAFVRDDPFIEYLHWNRSPVVTEELQLKLRGGERNLQPVVAAMRGLDAAVIIPSFVDEHCEGFLLLGEKTSAGLYTNDDLQVFHVLANQAALAIENAQFYEELKRTQADLYQTAKMASLGHMAGGMSHQVNNRFHVLTILAGTIKSVMKDLDPTQVPADRLKELWAKTLETFGKIEENALRGGDIVKTLLRFSRPSGEYKAVTLPQVLATARDVVQFRVNLGLMDVIQEIPEDLPAVRGDLNQLADCCFNLITNAFDAAQKKAEMIKTKQMSPAPSDPDPFRARLWIRAYGERKNGQPQVVLEMQDNGVGMTTGEIENLFIPFFTTKATTQKGTGLGLYVIHRIIEQHGGTITATSRYGVGATFALRLPVWEEAKAPA